MAAHRDDHDEEGVMPLFKKNPPTWREAEYPGHKNPKAAERGGTRREVAKYRAREAALSRIERDRKNADKRAAAADRAEDIKDRALERKRKADEAKTKAADQARKNQQEQARVVGIRELKKQKQAGAGKKQKKGFFG